MEQLYPNAQEKSLNKILGVEITLDMLLLVKQGIRGGIRYDFHRKDYAKNRESSSLKYWDENNLYE